MKPLHKILVFLSALALMALVIAWLAGAFVKKLPTENVEVQPEALQGEIYTVRASLDAIVEEATGTISARDEATISARILAGIRNISVRAGDSVKKDALLIELDDRTLRSRVEQIEQTVNAAEAALRETKSEYDRIKSLYQRRIAARAEYDRVEAALAGREAELGRSRRSLEEARTSLSYSTINSPIDGKVIERYAEPGDTATPGMPLLRIYNPNLLWLNANVRESLTSHIRAGDQLQAFVDAINKPLTVQIDEIVPSADPGSRSVTVKALLPQGEALYPGMFGRLRIRIGEIKRIYIPEGAIERVGQLEYVKVVKDGHSSRRFIRSGRRGENATIEAVSGLEEGEQILIKHLSGQALSPGQ